MPESKRPADDNSREEKKYPGYPPYPASEDIYRQDKEEKNIDPVDPDEEKVPAPANPNSHNERELDDAQEMGDDLDVPGAELDDANEEIGEEDEENNYYSLGEDEDSTQ